MKTEDSWIRQKNAVKSKQLPWHGKLNNNEKIKNFVEENKSRDFNKSHHETLPKSSTSNNNEWLESSKSSSVFPEVSSQELCSKQIDPPNARLSSLDSVKNQVTPMNNSVKANAISPRPKWMNKTATNGQRVTAEENRPYQQISPTEENPHQQNPQIEEKPNQQISSNPQPSSVKFPPRPVKPQWPPPNHTSEPDKHEETKNWSLGQNERKDIKLQLENVISGAKRRMEVAKDDDKENNKVIEQKTSVKSVDVISEQSPEVEKNTNSEPIKKTKNITKETLMKLLESEKEEQLAHASEDSTVVKCGLPTHQRPTEGQNNTDIEKCIRLLRNNDPTMKDVNLNNMKRTQVELVKRLLEAAKESSHLQKLSLANMSLNDFALEPLLELLETNSNLECLNLETNYLSGNYLSRLFQSCLKLQTLRELKVVNQSMTVGNDAELVIMKSVILNRGICKVSVDLRLPEARQKVDQALIRNGELRRLKRKIDAFDSK